MKYKIAVLIAIYKGSEFIKSKIECIKAQTIFNESQIVLLNCQNLENEDILYRDFLEHKNVIEIKYESHVTLYKSWNDGINATNSELVTNSNLDDQLHPEFLERCVKHLDHHTNIGILSTGVLVTHIPNQIWPHWKYHDRMPLYPYPESSAGPCPVWRRNLHVKYGYFDAQHQVIGDAIMWEKFLSGGEIFGLINDDLVLYYINPTSLERRRDDNGVLLRDSDLKIIGR